jgi:alpha-beta hydrolase superfamily lysophospholipase
MRQLRRLCSVFLDRCGEVRTPLLALHGTADNITAHEGSRMLIDRAASPDKTLRLYDGCFHCLIQGELDSNAALVLSDIKAWLDARTPPSSASSSSSSSSSA